MVPDPYTSSSSSWEWHKVKQYNAFLMSHPKPTKSEAQVSWDEKYNVFIRDHPKPPRSEAEVSWSKQYIEFINSYPYHSTRSNVVGNDHANVTPLAPKTDQHVLVDKPSPKKGLDALRGPDGELPQKLKNIPRQLIENICNEIMEGDPDVSWDDIAGLDHAKKCVTEMAVLPLLRPDIFKGCRSPGRGLLLFGPPGTGKTMIGKAIAGEAKATFFYISSSSLTSKWYGEGEKLVRALFGVASCRQPAVIFVDEIDSLLSKRNSDYEHDATRRAKTQLLIEMEGFAGGNDQVLLIGATNRPQELDEAARRRLTKRFYIPLPSSEARAWIIRNLLKKDGLFELSTEDIDSICKLTEGYSGSDMKNLVKDAAMGPVREALKECTDPAKLIKEHMRPVTLQDFEDSLQEVRPSVSLDQLGIYEDWNNQFGSLSPSKTDGSDSINHQRKKMRTSGAYTKSSRAQMKNDLDHDVYNNPYGEYYSEKMKVLKGIYETMQAKIRVKEINSLYKDTSNMSQQAKQIYLKRCQEIIEKYNL